MAGRETPLQAVKRLYESKDKLVEVLMSALGELSAVPDDLRERLRTLSNKKLLRLREVAVRIKEQYGSRDKLAQAVASALHRGKDSDFVAKLAGLPLPRLLDLAHSVERRVKAGKGRHRAAA